MNRIFILFCLLAATVEGMNAQTADIVLSDGRTLKVDFYSANIVRLFCDPQGGEMRDPVAEPPADILVTNPRRGVGDIKTEDHMVSSSQMSLVAGENGSLCIKHGDEIRISNLRFKTENGKTTVTFVANEKDYFYGGGVQNGRFSHRGEVIDIVNTNNWVDGGVASPAPFFWSTGGYGMMFYTFAPGKYDFGKTTIGEVVLSHDTDYLDLFIMINDGAVALLNDFYQLTGNPVLLPKFGFYEGHLNAYNRDYWKESEDGILYEDGKRYTESQKDNGGVRETLNGEENYQFSARAVVDRYLDNDFPLGWVLPNDGYGAGYGQTGSLDGNIQNLKQFGDYARSRGVEIGLWTQSDLHPKDGIEPLLQRDIVKEVRDAGVRVLKTDVAWVGAGYSFGLNGVADVAQIMPLEGQGARPFIISLDGWAGTQRYAGIWTGDQTGGEWEYIRFHIPTYIGSGLSGQPNITSDMDGIFGGRNLAVNIRDFQWKTFTPMQLNMDGWGSNPKYPQALGDTAAVINRWYLKLKSRLLPYSYSIAREATNGMPMIRAMFLEEENPFTLSAKTKYQYMYGPWFLVAPVYEESETHGVQRSEIYLPHGEWVDFFSGEIYKGDRLINDFDAPLWKLPLFVKRGAIVPIHKATNTPREIDPSLRQYAIWPCGTTEFTEYDDDGVTERYLYGNCVRTSIRSELKGKNLCIAISKADKTGDTSFFEDNKATQIFVFCSRVGNVKGLKHVNSFEECTNTDNSYYFGQPADSYISAPVLMVNIGRMNVAAEDLLVEVTGVEVDSSDHLLSSSGSLAAPLVSYDESASTAYTITLSWKAVENADYYELEFDGQLYSTIRRTNFTLSELSPNTEYGFRIRAVNRDGASRWTECSASTIEDPLKDAIRGITATTTCHNQPGQGVKCLFDFDEASTWHTEWGKGAVPFTLDIDLHSVNLLDHLQYIPRHDAGNGTLLEGSVETSMDRRTWTPQGEFHWQRSGQAKELQLLGEARYMRISVTKAVGNFGSGQQLYIFRQPDSEWYVQGDINQDGKLDDNDLTSYLNYTGLRRGDSDFEGYVSKGDVNGNGLIDAEDIFEVVRDERPIVRSVTELNCYQPVVNYHRGDTIVITVYGNKMTDVAALSFCLPYNPEEMEYLSESPTALASMYDMTRDRLHTNGQKALYPTFISRDADTLVNGDGELMRISFVAKKDIKFVARITDEMTVSQQPKNP